MGQEENKHDSLGKLPSNTAASAAGAPLQAALNPVSAGGLPCPAHCPAGPARPSSARELQLAWSGGLGRHAQGPEEREGRDLGRDDLENLPELQMAGRGQLRRCRPTPSWGGCRWRAKVMER